MNIGDLYNTEDIGAMGRIISAHSIAITRMENELRKKDEEIDRLKKELEAREDAAGS